MRPIEVQGRRFTRRSVLRGALMGGAVSVGLPLLDYFMTGRGRALACGGVIPVRFGLFFWGNGTRPERWVPTTEGPEWELTEELAPFANVKNRLSVLTGLSVKTSNTEPHTSGAAGVLSGVAPLVENDDATFALPSIDQLIAASIGGETLYRSLQTGVVPGTVGISHSAPFTLNPPELSPIALYDRLFGATFRAPGDNTAPDPTLGLRQSALDAVLDDLTRLQSRVGRADQVRLEQHMDGLRDLESRLARLQEDPPQLDACVLPPSPLTEYPDIDGRPQLSAINRAMCDLLVMALACDQTRVFSHMFSDPVCDALFPDASAGHHDLTHNEGGDQPEVHNITTFIMGEFAYLLEQMAALPEGEETLLDNCVVLGTSETGEALTHSIEEMPILLGGSACGRLKMGEHIRSYNAENVSHVMLSLVRAMDIPASEYGADEGYVTDGYSEIEA